MRPTNMRTNRLLFSALACSVLGLILVLTTACVAGIGKGADGTVRPVMKFGHTADQTVAAIDKAEKDGEIGQQSGDDVLGAIINVLGWALLGGGTAVGGVAGIRRVAKGVVSKYDNEPFTGPNGERVTESALVDAALRAPIAEALASDALSATDELKTEKADPAATTKS